MSSEPVQNLDIRRKQVLYRANHRGIKEMDILLGEFARERISQMDDDELVRFEALLDLPDQELLAWLTNARPAPVTADHAMLREIVAHRSGTVQK